jgi:hypothetical protein
MGHVERPQGESAYNDLQFTWQRWSRRRIARELGIDRETVGRYLLLAKPAISTTGDEGTGEAKTPTLDDGYLQLRTGQCSRPERTLPFCGCVLSGAPTGATIRLMTGGYWSLDGNSLWNAHNRATRTILLSS